MSTHCKVTGWCLRLRNFFAWNMILFSFPSTLSKGRLYNNAANSVCCLQIPFCASPVIVSLHENSSRDKKSKKGNGNHSWQHCTFYSLLTWFPCFNKTCYEIAEKIIPWCIIYSEEAKCSLRHSFISLLSAWKQCLLISEMI